MKVGDCGWVKIHADMTQKSFGQIVTIVTGGAVTVFLVRSSYHHGAIAPYFEDEFELIENEGEAMALLLEYA